MELGRTFSKTVSGLTRSNQYHKAWQLFIQLRTHKAKLNYNVYHDIIRAAIKAAEPSRALSAYEAIEADGLKANSVTTCILIRGLVQGSRKRSMEHLPDALRLWDNLRAGVAKNGVLLDTPALECGLHVCCRGGRMEEAEMLLKRLHIRQDRGPGVHIYNTMIRGFGTTGDVAGAQAMLQKMQLRGIAPDVVSFNALVGCLCEQRNTRGAREVMQQATSLGLPPDEWAWSALLQVQLEDRDLRGCQATVEDMTEARVKPTSITYSQLLHMCGLEASLGASKESAARVWEQYLASGVPLTTECYNAMLSISLLGDPRCGGHALWAIQEMRDRGLCVKTDTFNTVMTACVANGDFLQAVQLFSALIREGVAPNSISYTILMSAYQSLGYANKAIATYDRAQEIGVANLVASNLLVDVLVNARKLPEAAKVVDSLADAVRSASVPAPRVLPGFGAMAVGLEWAGDVEGAVGLLRRFNALGGIPDERFFDSVLMTCIRGNQFGYARQIVRAMKLSGLDVNVQRYTDVTEEMLDSVEGQMQPDWQLVALERFKFWLGMPNKYYTGG